MGLYLTIPTAVQKEGLVFYKDKVARSSVLLQKTVALTHKEKLKNETVA